MRIFLDNKGVSTLWSQFKAKLAVHADDSNIHVTAEEKAAWNGKAELSDIPDKLPANGGNAQALTDYNSTDVRIMLGWRGESLDSTNHLAGYDLSELESNGVVKIKDFPVSKLPLRAGNSYLDIFSTSLSSDHACWNKNCCVTGQSANADSEDYIENAPEITGNQLWYEVFTCGHKMRAYQIAFGCYRWQNNVFIRFKQDDAWSEWVNVSDGGNADTLDGLHANEIASNPNLLINSWFGSGVVNQRGQTTYPDGSGASNTIDCWKTVDGFDLTVNDDYITLSNGDSSWHKYFKQVIERLKRFSGQTATISAKVRYSTGDYYLVGGKHIDPSSDWQIVSHTITLSDADDLTSIYGGYGVSGSIDVMWIKLELGSIATPFCPPDPALELEKCQRYYQVRSTGDIPEVDLRPSMRTTPTVTQLSDGNYAYIAQL